MKISFSILLLITATWVKAQYKIVTIDDKTYMPNEPSIYINPFNPSQMVAGSNIHNHYVSSDTGKTWEIKRLTSSHGVYGDPVIYADEYGNFYFCHLSATSSKKYPNWIDRIVVQKSKDGGNTFSNGSFAGFNGDKEQDKHWIVKDQHSVLFKDNIYLSWTEFDKYDSKDPQDHSRIQFARSIDGAESFENAITISDTVGDCLDDDNTLEGATATIGKNGEVYVAWAGYGKIFMDKSTDGGVHWGKDKVIATQKDGWTLDFDHIYRSNGLPFLVTDHSRGKYRDRMYLLWGESDSIMGGEIIIKYSDDGGNTWSPSITVNSDSKGDQFMPHIAIDQTDGNIYVVFYDRRHSESNFMMDVYVAFSEDGGNTFTNRRITPHSFMPPGHEVFFGDYNGISATKGIIRPIWTGTTEENGGKTIIQTALLTKDLLENKEQLIDSTTIIKYIKGKDNMVFALYSTLATNYKLKIKLKKRKFSLYKHTYIAEGNFIPNEITELMMPTIRGMKGEIKLLIEQDGKKRTYLWKL